MDMSLYYLTHVSLFVLSAVTAVYSVNTHNIYSSGCSNERINLVCPENHKIAIKRLFYGIKNDLRCSGHGQNYSLDCCQPTHNDCLVVDDTKYPFLNMMCSGQRNCDIQAKSIKSGASCRAKGYSETTDYMSVIHDCIPDEDVTFLCSDSHTRGKLLYLSNANYPHPLVPGKQQCQCLIKTGNHVGIDIYALDIIITRSEDGNQCNQDIELRDDEGHRREITCGHPGLYAFRNIYNSDVRSVTLTLNNRSPKPQGYIWIQAKAKEDKDFVEIFCGVEMRQHLGYPVDDAESRTIDNKVPMNKDPTLDPINTGGGSNSSKASTPKMLSDLEMLVAGVATAAGVIITIGLIGIIILCVRRRHQRKKPVRQVPPPFPSPIMKSKDEKHASNTYCHYDYDEDKYCSIKRSPMRLTKYCNMDRSAGRRLKEAFAEGVACDDSLSQNGYVNYLEHINQISANQNEPLIEKHDEADGDNEEEDEIIMPRSEYITIGKAIQPRTAGREMVGTCLPPKKKMKNKTVTFSPVAMVTPLPAGLEESVPDDVVDDPKLNYLEIYSKTMPNRSPDKVKKIILVPGTQDDMCIGSLQATDCANVTEDDLWKVFHIKLSDHLSAGPELNQKKREVPKVLEEVPKVLEEEDPDYDENPYDNLPYINVGSLRRHNMPENNHNDLYKEVIKRNFSHEPAMECIPEN